MKPITLEDEVVKKWTDRTIIVGSHWNEKKENLKVVVKDDCKGSQPLYYLYRFFKVDGETLCSVDEEHKDAESFICLLLQKL